MPSLNDFKEAMKIIYRRSNETEPCVFKISTSKVRAGVNVDTILLAIEDSNSNKVLLSFVHLSRQCFTISGNTGFLSNIQNCVVHVYGLSSRRDGIKGYGVVVGYATAKIDESNDSSAGCDISMDIEENQSISFQRYTSILKDNITGIDRNHKPPSWYELTGLKQRKHEYEEFIIFLRDKHNGFCWVFTHSSTCPRFSIPFQLKPAADYEILILGGIKPREGKCMVSSYNIVSFRAYMTRKEIFELYLKAVRFISTEEKKETIISHLYRNKSPDYFRDIMYRCGGIMETYIKNFGGDQASTLNRNINGLFFSANVHPVTNQFPQLSFYGSERIHIPVYMMMQNGMNLYFADFYCHRNNHRVTLVLTARNTPSDYFCRARLHQLNPYFNHFLYKSVWPFFVVNANVTIEVFYTENINMASLLVMFPQDVFFTSVKCKGNPVLKTFVGREKNKNCKICNLNTVLRNLEAPINL